MKRLIFILLVLLSFIDVKAQFPTTDSLRNYNIVWITNNAARAFTNYRLHTLLAGMIDWIDTARTGGGGSIGIDSIAALNDSTLRYRINGTFRTFNLKGVYDSRRKVDTVYKTSDSTFAFTINGSSYSITLPGRTNFVDSIYRKAGEDSIFYRRNGIEYALLDSTGGSGAGSTNTNVGSGFRWAVVNTNQIKTFVPGYGLVADSTTNANAITARVDTTGPNGVPTRTELIDSTDITTQVESPIFVKLRATWPVPDTLALDSTLQATRARLYKVVDSTIALMVRVSDTASMLNNYVIGTGGAGRLTFWTATRSIGSDAQMTVDATSNTITVDSLAAHRTHVTQVLVNANDNIITPPDSAHAGGDSYTAGTGATTYDSSHIPYWSRHMGFTVSNYAVGGKGVWWMAKEHILRLSPGHRAMAFQFAGFNDQRRNSSNRRTLNKIIDAYKSVFINQYAATSVAAGNGTGVTRHGTWTTNYDPVSVGGKSAATGAYTTLAGDSIRYSFSGTSVFFTYIGADNSGAGFNYSDSLDIYIDGALQERIGQNNRWDGVTDGAYDNRRGPGGWFKTGMVSGSHVLTVINRHAGNFCTFDRFGTLVPRQEAMPLYMYHAAYNNLAGFAVSPSNGSIAAVDEVNNKLDSLYATLPTSIYPVYMVPSDQILDTLTDYNADNIHPNNLGHRKLYEGALAEFDPLEGAQDGLLERNEADWFITIGGQRRKILTGSTAADTLAIYASPSAQQTAFININSSSMHTIGGRITVGSTSLGTATASFRNIVRNNFVYDTYEFGSRIYHWNRNNAGTDGVATTIGGSSINFSTLAASAESIQATINTTGLGIGTTSPDNKLHSELSGSGTNTIGYPFRISTITSATAAPGYGVGMQFEAENGSGNNVVTGRITNPYTTVTNTSESADIVFEPIRAGTITEGFRITSTGAARFNNAFTFPTADGTNGQVLQTNGSGAVTWQTVSSSGNFILQFSNTQAVTVSNTSAETTIYGTGQGSAGIDGTANITAGTKIVLKGSGTIDTDAAVDNDFEFSFDVGNTTLGTNITTLAAALNNAYYEYEYVLIPVTTGTNQDAIYQLSIYIDNNGTPLHVKTTGRFSGAFTTTGTVTCSVNVNWVTADAENQVESNFNTVELFKK